MRNNGIEKLEKDMKTNQANFGIIVATCYKQSLIKLRIKIFFH